jgi:hypothetical protein
MWAVSREDDMALAAAGGADDALRPADTLRPKRRAARMMVGGSCGSTTGCRGGGGWRRLVASAWYLCTGSTIGRGIYFGHFRLKKLRLHRS